MASAAQDAPDHRRTGSEKLEDQAATAALYVTQGQSKSKSKYPLNEDNRLSSAGAATSLKYASPQNLPSFPSVGIADQEFSADKAANLANANHRSFEHWKPDASSAASKAAMLAKDYKAPPLWHPEMSAAGSKAALLAAKEGGNVNIWRPEGTQAGNSAATQAMRMKGLSPPVDYGYTADGSKKALLAATASMSGSRKRAGSSPIVNSPSYPDSANATGNALNAATVANRSKDAGRNPALTNFSREMYTSNPPVAPEVDEKNRQAGLRAAAVSMAKQLYDVQQKAIEQAAADLKIADSRYAASSVHARRRSSLSSTDEVYVPPQYANLQEAAQKLAAERLAKLHDEHAAYRNYYGTNNPPQSRMSIRGRTRRRASSDGTRDADEEQSRKIRSQMTLFSDQLAQVDAKKRQTDRDTLMAIAQKNVTSRMHGMDEKVFADTGKASPALQTEWEAKANARAQADSQARMVNYGKVNIGGGKYLDQSEIDAIAAARVQPTLDEITAKAEKQRARDEEIRLEQAERRRLAEEKAQAERDRELRTKEDWRRFKEEEKREERAKKEEERARRAEERRLHDESKRKPRNPMVISKPIAAAPIEETIVDDEAPALDPIPKLEPISAESAKDDVEAVSKVDDEASKVDEEAITPAVEAVTPAVEAKPQDESEPINTVTPAVEQVSTLVPESAAVDAPSALASTSAEESTPAPMSEDSALSVAERVFSAPVVDQEQETKEVQGTTDVSSPTVVAGTPAAAETPAAVVTAPAINTERAGGRVKPTSHTTVTGPQSSSSLPKGESKVSSWLKNKFSRRASKPSKPEVMPAPETSSSTKATASGPPEKPHVAPPTSDDGPDSSVHEVAIAGRHASNTSAEKPAPKDADPHPHQHSNSAPGAPSSGKARRRSTSSVSSLSSRGEAGRGRSDLRRADTVSSQGDEFEEARDHFDEKLAPPPTFASGGSVSNSPVRDSRFQEDL